MKKCSTKTNVLSHYDVTTDCVSVSGYKEGCKERNQFLFDTFTIGPVILVSHS